MRKYFCGVRGRLRVRERKPGWRQDEEARISDMASSEEVECSLADATHRVWFGLESVDSPVALSVQLV